VLKYVFPDNLNLESKEPLYMLHGYGSNEVDLFMLNDRIPEGYFPVSLRAPYRSPYGGYAWYDISVDARGQFVFDNRQMKQSLIKLEEEIRRINARFGFKMPVNLLGFSQGSILSYLFLTFFPEKVSNIVAFSGYIHESLMAPFSPGSVRHIRVFASHGVYDDIIPVERARKISPYLSERNITHVYKEYHAGHYLTDENIADAMSFLEKRWRLNAD